MEPANVGRPAKLYHTPLRNENVSMSHFRWIVRSFTVVRETSAVGVFRTQARETLVLE